MISVRSKKNIGMIIRENYPAACIVGIIILCSLSILFYGIGRNHLFHTASEAYEESLNSERDRIYEEYKKRGKSAYNTSNNVSIVVDQIQETSELEVMSVGANVYVSSTDEKIWESITGSTYFVVNMKEAEYAIDNERRTVFVRIPEPRLKETISIDDDSLKVYEMVGDGKINQLIQDMTGSIKVGEEEALRMRRIAVERILDTIKGHPEYPVAAETAATSLIESLVKSVNAGVSDLRVEVEFY